MNLKENCLIIAGEKSGEDHCMSFFLDLKRLLPSIEFWGVGGDELEKNGMELIYHLKDFSSFGISEVIFKIPFYIKAFNRVVDEVDKRQCKVAILIDFQTFNLKLAKKLKKKGIVVLYYVAPQAWAWKAYRTAILEKTVHTLFTIIPFEKKWFEDRGVSCVKNVPHPLWYQYSMAMNSIKNKSFEDINKEFNLLLLPGSRSFEVKYMLPIFYRALKEIKKKYNVKVSIVRPSNIDLSLYENYKDEIDCFYENDQLNEALIKADFSFATSGTITLACALFNVPTVVGYKGTLFNEMIFNIFVRYKWYISLANIVHDQLVFPEFTQNDATENNFTQSLSKWLNNGEEYKKTINILSKTKDLIGGELENVSPYMNEVIQLAYEN